MTPTLAGRIQSRLFLLATLGAAWTAIIIPVLAAWIDAESVGDVYVTGFLALAVVAVVGIVWDVIYIQLQEYRWEKDWPALFGLLNGINEFITTAIGLAILGQTVNRAVVVHFATLWILIWFVANGPFRVFWFRTRFRGGKLA